MDKAHRKALSTAWKDQAPDTGVFMLWIDGQPTRWIGTAPRLSAMETRLRFELRMGQAKTPALQAAYKAHGADALCFEVLEVLKDDLSDMARARILKERHAHWIAEKGGTAL